MSKEIQDILDICLERILSQGEEIESCVADYPDVRAELEPLLELALAGTEVLSVRVPTEVKDAGWQIVAESAAARTDTGSEAADTVRMKKDFSSSRTFMGLSVRMLKPVALAAGIIVLLFAGTAVAATGAEPDSPIYPMKLALEDIRTVVAFQDIDQAGVEAGHADARLDEIVTMVDEEKADYVPRLLDDYDDEIGSAENEAGEARSDGLDTEEVEERIDAVRTRHDRILLAIAGEIPDDVRSEIEDDINDAAKNELDSTGDEQGTSGADDASDDSSSDNQESGETHQPGHEDREEPSGDADDYEGGGGSAPEYDDEPTGGGGDAGNGEPGDVEEQQAPQEETVNNGSSPDQVSPDDPSAI